MACPCEASAPCEEQTLAVAAQQHSATVAQPQGMSFEVCADCGNTSTAFVPLFIVALLLVALLRSLRRRTPFLTLGLSAGSGHVIGSNPAVANLHHAAGAPGQRGIVRDDHQRAPLLPQLGEERHDVAA